RLQPRLPRLFPLLWDDTVKLWTLDRPTSVCTFKEHAYCVYSAVWNPHVDVFASASGHCTSFQSVRYKAYLS
ncbi:hypothetical protein VIGAN_10108900, partial [Vigna angularis var. angularis]